MQHVRIEAARAVQEQTGASEKPRSLVVQIARKMVVWACLNTLILTAIGYYFVSERVEQRTLAYLAGYMTERVRSEGQVFLASEANLAKVRDRFLAQYRNPRVLQRPDFAAYFERKADRSIRMRERFFSGTIDPAGVTRSGMSGFLLTGRRPTAELQRRMVLAYQIVAEAGPAWKGDFTNLYTALPENGGILYWPEVPWGLRVPMSKPNRLHTAPWWSSVYFDTVARKWNVTYQIPVYDGGRMLLLPGQDILLDDLMMRLTRDHPPGGYNLILRKDGELIGHPKRLGELSRSTSGLNVANIGDAGLKSIYAAILADSGHGFRRGEVRIVEDSSVDAYICYGEMAGPGWWFVTVYPRSLVLESAHEAANGLLLLGFGSFAIMTLIVIWVLRERVARPISLMRSASEKVSSGDYESVANGSVTLPVAENNEIGIFAQSFRRMAKKVGDVQRSLEETVVVRTLELRRANEELETLSFKDGLTGVNNRRSFDLDLTRLIEDRVANGETSALMLCDIDFFKLYNDTYGHPAGDRVLRAIAQEMARCAPRARVYRYGGEEMALLLVGSDGEACHREAANVMRGIVALAIPHEASPNGIVTISAGLVTIVSPQVSPAEVVTAADRLLYKAKHAGRNRLVDGRS